MARRVVRVRLGRDSYRVVVAVGAVEELPAVLREIGPAGGVACVTDRRVEALHGVRVRALIEGSGVRLRSWSSIPRGERSKSLAVAEGLCSAFARAGLGRDGLVVALGGGVVGDVAGFAASIYHRGIPCIQLPTTLLAQVDSSVGGKTGVNLPEGKNLVGAFHQPRAVLCDAELLGTLSVRDVRSGLAEAIKHGVIRDAAYFALVDRSLPKALALEPAALAAIVHGSCRIKAQVVAADERESGVRAILNFGHTIGHAIETVGEYRAHRHGEAVAIGMLGATWIAAVSDRCDWGLLETLEATTRRAGLPEQAPGLPTDAVIAAMRGDKKARAGRLRWVLPTALGSAEVVDDVPDSLWEWAVERLTG